MLLTQVSLRSRNLMVSEVHLQWQKWPWSLQSSSVHFDERRMRPTETQEEVKDLSDVVKKTLVR